MNFQQFKNKIKLSIILNKTKEKYSGQTPTSIDLARSLVEWLEDLDTLFEIEGVKAESELPSCILQHLHKKPKSSYFYNLLDYRAQYKNNVITLYCLIFDRLDLSLEQNRLISNCFGSWDISFYLRNKPQQTISVKEGANINTVLERCAQWNIDSFVDLEKRVDLLVSLSLSGVGVSKDIIKDTLRFMRYQYDSQKNSKLFIDGQSYDLLSLIARALSTQLQGDTCVLRKEFLNLLALNYDFDTITNYQSLTGRPFYEKDKQGRQHLRPQLLWAPLTPEDMNTILVIKEKSHLNQSIDFIVSSVAKKTNKI